MSESGSKGEILAGSLDAFVRCSAIEHEPGKFFDSVEVGPLKKTALVEGGSLDRVHLLLLGDAHSYQLTTFTNATRPVRVMTQLTSCNSRIATQAVW
jgi:hypothetical protein